MDRTRVTSIDYFNRDHPLHGIKIRSALKARRHMYDRVLRLTSPGPQTRVLDVGVTPDLEIPYNNFFERWYPHTDRLTACSIEDCRNLEAEFKGLTFALLEGSDLPFRDHEFDVALSFAVLEHVGNRNNQQHLLRELARVSNAFVVYTPYRYFPVEMHTLLPLLHWLPTRTYRTLWHKMGLTFWADERNLNLLSLRTVRELLPPDGQSAVRLVWSHGWPSNIEIHWRRAAAPRSHAPV